MTTSFLLLAEGSSKNMSDKPLTWDEVAEFIQRLFETLHNLAEFPGKTAAMIGFFAAFISFFVLPLLHTNKRAFMLLFNFYRGEKSPFFAALTMLIWIMWECMPGFKNWKRLALLFDATRIVIEFELLNPHDKEEEKATPSTSKFQRRILAKQRRQARQRWAALERTRLRKFITLCDEGRSFTDLPPITVHDCFALTDKEDEAKRYFQALLSDLAVISNKRKFLSSVEFRVGYVAPLYLIIGSLNRFGENWAPIHNYYCQEHSEIKEWQNKFSTKTDYLDILRSVQLHEFDCWLLWGPSIPICNCSQWHDSYTHGSGGVALQFGFGDENNSLPLWPNELDSPDELTKFQGLFDEVIKPKPDRGLAQTTVLRARPIWATATETEIREDASLLASLGRLCPAQKGILDENGPEIALDYISHQPAFDEQSGGYYSAYLWVMFVLCKKDTNGNITPIFPPSEDAGADDLRQAEEWKGMLPFFEHANIANHHTYDALREMLAAKAVRELDKIVKNCLQDDLVFVCVCSFDKTCCGAASPPATDNENINDKSIVNRIKNLVKNSGFYQHMNDYVFFPADPKEKKQSWENPESFNWAHFSSCHLPNIIKRYFERLDENDKANAETVRDYVDITNLDKRFEKQFNELSKDYSLVAGNFLIHQETMNEKSKFLLPAVCLCCIEQDKLVGICSASFSQTPESIIIWMLRCRPDYAEEEIETELLDKAFSMLRRKLPENIRYKPFAIHAFTPDPFTTISKSEVHSCRVSKNEAREAAMRWNYRNNTGSSFKIVAHVSPQSESASGSTMTPGLWLLYKGGKEQNEPPTDEVHRSLNTIHTNPGCKLSFEKDIFSKDIPKSCGRDKRVTLTEIEDTISLQKLRSCKMEPRLVQELFAKPKGNTRNWLVSICDDGQTDTFVVSCEIQSNEQSAVATATSTGNFSDDIRKVVYRNIEFELHDEKTSKAVSIKQLEAGHNCNTPSA